MPVAGARSRSPRGTPGEGQPPLGAGGWGSAHGRPLSRRRIAPRGAGFAAGGAAPLAAAPAPAGLGAAAAEKFRRQPPGGAVKKAEVSRGPGGAGLPPPRAGGQRQGRSWGSGSGSFCRPPERRVPQVTASRPVLALRWVLLRLPSAPAAIAPPEPRVERGSASANFSLSGPGSGAPATALS